MSKLALRIPVYNASTTLPRLLTSANKQAIHSKEILVYSDCSTNDRAEVAERFGAKVLHGKTNMGCAFGKNGIAVIVESDWLYFHDADDDLMPNFTKVDR